ncbi:MAG: hypothetical protein WD751_05530 [Anaerolineales bacterium]
MKLTQINPDALHKNPAFSQGISIEGAAKQRALSAHSFTIGGHIR